jgi:hypothetical protein
MADHLASGRVRDAEIAIEKEFAQAFSHVVGIAWLDVGEFADDSVLVHDDLHRLFVRVRRPNFRQGRIDASQLCSCHARIAPAALHRGDLTGDGDRHAEAYGGRSEFRIGKFDHGVAGACDASCGPRRWHDVMQGLPEL